MYSKSLCLSSFSDNHIMKPQNKEKIYNMIMFPYVNSRFIGPVHEKDREVVYFIFFSLSKVINRDEIHACKAVFD